MSLSKSSRTPESRSSLTQSPLSRRRFLMFTGSALALAACAPAAGPSESAPAEAPEATAPDAPEPTAAPAVDSDEVEVMVQDVLDYKLDPDGWEGPYGQVTMRVHEGIHNGESLYYITTDTSDPTMAEEVGLVHVPLLNAAQGMDNVNVMYTFEDDRPAIFKWIPGDENYGSLFRYRTVTVEDDSLELASAEDVEAAIESGGVSVADDSIFVNYPIVKWSGGELSVDPDLTGVLPGGQLFEAVDTENMTVIMKLHQCYPGSRYILTDTAAAGPASMMNVPAAPPTQQLKELGGSDEIWVFGNGIPGPGVMGFQPAIFDNKAGEPAWSPFWDHFTVTWVNEDEARVLTSSDEIRELVEDGTLEEWNGTPDSHPNGFIVNCPSPILAPNTFEA